MADQELVNYIRNQLNAGHSPEEVRTHLVGYGHPIREVEDAIDFVLGPPAQAPAPAPAQMAPPMPATTIQPAQPSGVWEVSILKLLKNWFMSLAVPGRVFREMKSNASFSAGFKNMLMAGIIGGFIAGFMAYADKGAVFDMFTLSIFSMSTILASIPGYTLLSGGGDASTLLLRVGGVMFIPLFSWLFLSSFTYLFALFTGARGMFKTHSYLISIYLAPISIILILIFGAVDKACALFLIPTIISFYAIYPLTFAIKEAHDTDMLRAVLAWLIPLILFLLLFVMGWDAATDYLKLVC